VLKATNLLLDMTRDMDFLCHMRGGAGEKMPGYEIIWVTTIVSSMLEESIRRRGVPAAKMQGGHFYYR
jgi:hypothetical protein